MDITASIVDSRSLSQSELILRSLFSTLQVGGRSQAGQGVIIQGATFRSGTVENPLVVTLKNSQTETVMYVRNIPISLVLERNGLHKQWVAVYPPGDPQNLHFDTVSVPKEGYPAVCISVSIVEDLSSTVITPSQPRGSLPFDPQPRSSAGPGQADQLRRSVDSLQEELARARQRVDGLGSGALSSRSTGAAASFGSYSHSSAASASRANSRGMASRVSGAGFGSAGDLNNTVQDVSAKAQQIKDNLTRMRSASLQAKESTSRLTEQRRVLENLKQQLQALELQLRELLTATETLTRNRDELRAEEAQLIDQIEEKERTFQELQRSRDEVDQEIHKALGEGERQKQNLEVSTREFGLQKKNMADDLEQSRAQVVSLRSSLQGREEVVSQLERKILQDEENLAAEEAAERERMRSSLDQTRSSLLAARNEAEEHQRRFRTADGSLQELSMRINAVEGEASSLRAAIEGDYEGEEMARVSTMQAADLDTKLNMHLEKVKRLEDELRDNRERLDGMNDNVTELHSELREMELAANRCEDQRTDIQAQLEAHKSSTEWAEEQNRLLQEQLQEAEAELERSQDELQNLESVEAQGRDRHVQAASALQTSLEGLREEQRMARLQADELQQHCEALEAQAREKRAQVEERGKEIADAQARVEQLTKELSAASTEMAEVDEKSKPLRQQLANSQAQLETARKRTKATQEQIAAFRTEAATDQEAASGKLSRLDETRSGLRQEIGVLSEAGQACKMRHAELQGSLAQSEEIVARLQKEIDRLIAAKQEGEGQVRALAEQREIVDSELKRGAEELARLEQGRRERMSDLETTKRTAEVRNQEILQLEAQNRAEIEQMEAAAAELSAAQAERQRLVGQLCQELKDVQTKCDKESEVVATEHRERTALEAELARLCAEQNALLQQGQDALSKTQQAVTEASLRVSRAGERKEEAVVRMREAEGRREELGSKAALARSEAEEEARRVSEAESRLNDRRAALEAMRGELEKANQEVAELEARGATAEAEVASSRARVQALEHAHTEVEELQRRHAALQAEERADEEQHVAALAAREKEVAASREELERTRQGLMRKKEEEISRQAMQIGKLEEERRSLLAQAIRLEEERAQLDEGLRARLDARRDVLADTQRKAADCDDLEATLSALKTTSSQLREKEAEMDQKLGQLREREELLRQESLERERGMQAVRSEMEDSERQAAKQVEEQKEKLKGHIQAKANFERECEEMQHKLASLTDDVAALLRDSSLADGQAEEMQDVLSRTKAELQSALADRDAKRRDVQEQAAKLAAKAGEVSTAAEVQKAAAMVCALEERLQRLSDQLVGAQERVRQGHAREEELRMDLLRAKEQLRGAEDKMNYQIEHDKIQRDAIESMLEQKTKSDQEVEMFVLGLHEAEQRNDQLQKANSAMQQQVEELYQGSLQDWANQVDQQLEASPQALRVRDDIEHWKQRAEQLRKEKTTHISRLQLEHEESVQQLRDRIVAAQAELDGAQQAVTRRQTALAKRREHGEVVAPAPGGVPGLVVPQRPLPCGHQRRRALLIGINYPLSHAPLKGCVNDVWNMQCLLRYTLQYREDQLRLLLDCADGRAPRSDRAPTKANIVEGLQWLTDGAQPGDNLLLVFCGYGTQHPTTPGSDLCEGYLVPSDFAADLPASFLSSSDLRGDSVEISSALSHLDMGLPAFERSFQPPRDGNGAVTPRDAGAGYRLVSLLEVNSYIVRLPKICRMSVILDCCYGGLPHITPVGGLQARFPKVSRGRVDYQKLRDFISRPRFLELPPLRVQHTPGHLLSAHPLYPNCWLHVFAGCRLEEWCAEFPIEGTVQGAFSWAFLKALAKGHFHCGLYQFQQMLVHMLANLKSHFKGVGQTPLLQLSQAASMQDVVLWT